MELAPAVYVLLADRADANDRVVMEYGELPAGVEPPPLPDDGRLYEPHYRADFDRQCGLDDGPVHGPVDDGPVADTNVIDLAQWVSETNRKFDELPK